MNLFLKRKESNSVNETCLGTYCGYGIREELYQNEGGEFFLVGKGGPSTKYAVHCCGNLIGGSKITPLSYESAQEWGKDKLSATEFETIFCSERSDAGVEKSKSCQR